MSAQFADEFQQAHLHCRWGGWNQIPYDLVPGSSSVRRSPTRVAVGVAINLLIAGLHLLDLRALLGPELRPMIGSYFSDLTLPFAFYYLLCFIDDRAAILRPAAAKAGVVFLASAGAEVLQGAGVPALGRTFDPVDFAMYAAGVGLAAALDRLLLSRLVRAWPLVPSPAPGDQANRAPMHPRRPA